MPTHSLRREARVAVVPRTTYEGDLVSVVREGLEAIGADVQGARVVLKPNFVEFDPRFGDQHRPASRRGHGRGVRDTGGRGR